MLPVTTEYPLAEIDVFPSGRVLGHLVIGVLVGCAVALILCFLVITFHEPVAGHADTSVQGVQARPSQSLVRSGQRGNADTEIASGAMR